MHVSTDDGVRVGWLEVPTGKSTLEYPE